MNKQNLIKVALFFTVSFIIMLIIMTAVLGFLRPKASDPNMNASQSDSSAVIAGNVDSTEQAGDSEIKIGTLQDTMKKISPRPERVKENEYEKAKIDSLLAIITGLEKEKKQLELQLQEQDENTQQQEQRKNLEAEREANAKQVAKIYEKMDAQEAAGILAGMQTEIAVSIIAAMKDRQAAKILQSMDPKLAVVISKKLTQYN